MRELTWRWWRGGQAAGGWGDVPRDEGEPSAHAWSGHPPPGVPAGSAAYDTLLVLGVLQLCCSLRTHIHTPACYKMPSEPKEAISITFKDTFMENKSHHTIP